MNGYVSYLLWFSTQGAVFNVVAYAINHASSKPGKAFEMKLSFLEYYFRSRPFLQVALQDKTRAYEDIAGGHFFKSRFKVVRSLSSLPNELIDVLHAVLSGFA